MPPARPYEHPLAQLERSFIAEFLRARGYEPDQLQRIPAAQVHQLMKQASVYASAKLSEVEARAHLLADMHAGGDDRTGTS